MKILFYSAILALAAVICSCSNNDDDNKESSKDSNAKESGYVGDFSGKEASVLFAVEAPSAGSYSITIKGRAKGGSAGTGVLTANGSDTDITFAGSDWSECKATVNLNKGINDVEISRSSGNGLFYIDYIELK